MIEFNNLRIEGFCSIPKLELALNTPGFTLIKAPNGCGKSTIFSAIVWALYGKNLKGNSDVNTWEKYRPAGYQGTKVEIYFKVDGKVCKVTRCLNYKGDVKGTKGASRLIFEIDTEIVPEKNKLQIQERINKTLGLSYNLFMNSVMFGQGLKRLIQESSSDQKKVFEELFDVTYLNEAKTLAQNKLNFTLEQYNKIISQKNCLEVKRDALKSKLKGFRSMKDSRNQNIEREIQTLENKIHQLNKSLQDIPLTDLDNSNMRISKDLELVSENIQNTKEIISKASKVSGISIQELIGVIISLLKEGKSDKALDKLTYLQSNYEVLETNNKKLISLKDQQNKLTSEKYEVNRKISQYNTLDHEKEDLVKRILNLRKDQDNSEYTKEIKSCKKEIKEIRNNIHQLSPQLSVLDKNGKLYKWAYSEAFGNNGIKAFLFESSVDDINRTLESYEDILGFRIQFTMDVQGTRKDFRSTIRMEGVEVPYEDLSGGQQQLVNLAMAFAMNEVVFSIKGINITFLDEVFESLSEDNIEIVISLLRHIYKNRSLYLITHISSLPLGNSRVIKVSRVKGLSYYE